MLIHEELPHFGIFDTMVCRNMHNGDNEATFRPFATSYGNACVHLDMQSPVFEVGNKTHHTFDIMLSYVIYLYLLLT